MLAGFVAVGAYVWSERRYWDRVESHWHADAVQHVAKTIASSTSKPSSAVPDDEQAAVVVVVPSDADSAQHHATHDESPSSRDDADAAATTVLVVEEPADAAAPPAADASLLEELVPAPVSPMDQLSDVDSVLLADRLAQLIESQRIDAARAADPNNYLRSVSQLLDEAVQLARDADERAAAQAGRIAGLELRIRAVERFAVTQRAAAHRLHRLERATLGLTGALQEQRPFVNELAALTEASAQIDDVPLLQAAAALVSADDARRGVMQTAALSELFVDIIEASKVAESMQHANNAPTGSDAPAWWKRAYASVVRNVTVWPAGVPDGDGPAAVAARANWYLEHGQLQRCLGELRQIAELPDVRKAAAPFLSEAERRMRLENVVSLAMSDIDRLLGDDAAALAADPHQRHQQSQQSQQQQSEPEQQQQQLPPQQPPQEQ